jgi:tetratricopeptide (TPR) repeat protein
LDKVGKFEEAVGIYEKASAIEPGNQLAWFNLGAMYVNKGAALYKDANSENDVKKAQELQEQAKGYFQKGLPALKKAQEIEPCDRDILKTLMQIAINLELTEDYAAYKAKLKECEG